MSDPLPLPPIVVRLCSLAGAAVAWIPGRRLLLVDPAVIAGEAPAVPAP
jgi:hypothetical protein